MKLTRKVLHNVARPLDFQYPVKNQQLVNQMLGLMRLENGIGLAAPQIGISKRLFVMSVDGHDRACFNPEIVSSSAVFTDFQEGCLSFPGESCIIKRPEQIRVKYQNHFGDWIEVDLAGLEARCFQHELDHLNGITMHDRAKEQHATES
jgi:peptide deformylase